MGYILMCSQFDQCSQKAHQRMFERPPTMYFPPLLNFIQMLLVSVLSLYKNIIEQ